jgi:hypothetical protein
VVPRCSPLHLVRLWCSIGPGTQPLGARSASLRWPCWCDGVPVEGVSGTWQRPSGQRLSRRATCPVPGADARPCPHVTGP